VVIGRFALSEALHGKGLGGELLADALHRVVAATQLVAARFVVVDAIDARAMAFYEHFGFRHIPDAMRLVRKMSSVAADLQA
jgi:predicted GNAT family N-acyltransferase